MTTRRQFLTYGAVGLATATATGAGLLRWGNRSASAQTEPGVRKITLDITHRIQSMPDGTPLFMWMYKQRGGNGGAFPAGAALPPQLADGTYAPPEVRSHYWASVFPERVIAVQAGEQIEITLTNLLSEHHNLAIREDYFLGKYFRSETLPPGASTTFTLPPLEPGTYIFEDDVETLQSGHPVDAPLEDHGGIYRSLGLHGVLIVSPPDPYTVISSDTCNTPITRSDDDKPTAAGTQQVCAPVTGFPIEFERQYVWIFNDHDPAWNALAQAGRAKEISIASHIPRYFTLNDRAGVESSDGPLAGLDTRPCGKVRHPGQPGQLIRVVNAGLEIHGMHIHGNHVTVVRPAHRFQFGDFTPQGSAASLPVPIEDPINFMPHLAQKDVVPIHPRDRADVILPFETPRDCARTPTPGQIFHYPMHSHSEPSQTAGGGLYPGGQLTDWFLIT